MGKFIDKKLLITPLMLAFVAVTACSTVGEKFKLPSFGNKGEAAKKKDDGRIAILTADEELKPDEGLAAVGASAPPSLPLTSWSNASGNPNATIENITGDGSLSIAWKKKLGAGANKSVGLIGQPLIADNKIMLLDASLTLHAYSADGQKKLWSVSLGEPKKKGWFKSQTKATAGGIGYENGVIVAASGFGEIIGIDATNGKIMWRFVTDAPVHSSPLVANGRAYAVSVTSQLYAIDDKTGELVWTQSGLTESARVLSSSSSVIQGDTLITPFSSGEVVASLTANGRRLWNESLSRVTGGNSLASINDIAGHPVINDGAVYAVSQSGLLAAIDLRSGVKTWDKSISSIQSPWVAGAYVYVVSVDAELYCLEKSSGRIVWMTQLDRFKNAKKKKGKIVWTGPVMVEGHLVLASSEGEIVEVNPTKGEIVNKIKGKEEFLIAPSVADGTVYFLAKDGTMVSLK